MLFFRLHVLTKTTEVTYYLCPLIYPFLARYDIQDLPEVDCRPGLHSVCVSIVNIDRPMDICLLTETILHLSIYIYVLWVVANPNKRDPPP